MIRFGYMLLLPSSVNRLPGLQSSQQNRLEENKVYDGMMVDVIRLLVLPPIVGCAPVPGLFEVNSTCPLVFWVIARCVESVLNHRLLSPATLVASCRTWSITNMRSK